MILLPTTTTEQFRPLSNAGRIEVWRQNSTAGIPQASGRAVKRQSVPLSIPLVTSNPRASGTAERALICDSNADAGAQAQLQRPAPGAVRQPGLILTHEQTAMYMAAFGRVPQDEGEQYAADECLEV